MQESQKVIKIYLNKEFFEILKLAKVIDEYQAFFTLFPNSLEYSMLDPSHIQLLHVSIFPYNLENLDCENSKFGIRIGDFLNIINDQDLKNILTLEIDIDLINKKLRTLTNTVSIEGDLIEVEGSGDFAFLPEPKLDAEVEAEINLRSLLNAIKGNFDEVLLSVENSRLFTHVKNEDIKKKTFIPAKFILTKSNETHACYSVYYLFSFLKRATKLTSSAKISFSNEKPLNIKFSTKTSSISYWLAPRVE